MSNAPLKMQENPHNHVPGAKKNGAIIEVSGLVKKFGSKSVLRKIDLNLEKGEFLALFGPNGAGKTTLIQILCSLMLPTSGEIRISGLNPRYDREAIHSLIGVVLHETFLYDNLSAFENLKFYGTMYEVSNLEVKIKNLLNLVGLSEYQNSQIHTFSRGMKQRLSIARAIIHDPSVLLLDEPYNGLDQKGIEDLKLLLQTFHNERKTIIMTSHHLDTGLELCSHAAILKSGRFVYKQKIQNKFARDFTQIYRQYTVENPTHVKIAV